jgi:cell division protein FtsW
MLRLVGSAPGQTRPPGSTPSGRAEPTTERATRRKSRHVVLLALVGTLCLIGLVMVLSSSSVVSLRSYGTPWHYFIRQGIWLAVGTAAFFVAQMVPMAKWRLLARPLMIMTVLMLMAVLVVGRSAGGASRWIGTSSVQLQPSELAKLALILFAADILERRLDHRDWLYRLAPVLAVLFVTGALIMKQPDMGTTVVVFCIGLAIMFAASAPVRTLSALITVSFLGGAALTVSSPYRYARLMSFRHPFADASGAGWQSAQALVAMSEGHLTGAGIGDSVASWGYLPNQWTDFIFAIIGEETGLIGAAVVVGLFGALGFVGTRIACRAQNRFDALVAAGVTTWLVAQAVINIGAVVGVLPVTGVPLPFVSYGGTSLIFMLFGAGLLSNVARRS